MDATAIAQCRDNGMPLVVFELRKPGEMKKAVMGEKVGTTVKKQLTAQSLKLIVRDKLRFVSTLLIKNYVVEGVYGGFFGDVFEGEILYKSECFYLGIYGVGR